MGFRDDLNDDMVKNHLNADEFGELVTYTPATGMAVTIPAVYDRVPFTEDGAEVGVIAYRPRLICRQVDMPVGSPNKGDKITLVANEWHKAGTFRVIDHSLDDLGSIEMILQAAR